jgi:hypothetical protein
MRLLVKITPNHQIFNQWVKDGSAPEKMQAILTSLKPEAVYFTLIEGRRSLIAIVNIDEASQMATLLEPWFLQLEAQVEAHPVMLQEDLMKADLVAIGKKWG